MIDYAAAVDDPMLETLNVPKGGRRWGAADTHVDEASFAFQARVTVLTTEF